MRLLFGCAHAENGRKSSAKMARTIGYARWMCCDRDCQGRRAAFGSDYSLELRRVTIAFIIALVFAHASECRMLAALLVVRLLDNIVVSQFETVKWGPDRAAKTHLGV